MNPDLKPHEYMCMHRPLFDYEIENRARGDDQLERKEMFEKECGPGFEAEKAKAIFCKPASEVKDWKWIIMLDGWDEADLWSRRAKYCDPDNFNMYIYNDFKGWGLQEVIENIVSRDSKVRTIRRR